MQQLYFRESKALKTKKVEVQKSMKTADVVGCSWVHLKDGKTVERAALGKTLPGKQASELKLDTPMPVASLSKAVFSYLVLRLVKEGLIDLDEPLYKTSVHEHLKKVGERQLGASEHLKRVTPRLVLQHREGFPVDIGAEGLLRFEFEPGEEFSYSGLGFAWLQEVIQKKTGESLETLAQQYVFGPLEMEHSSFLNREESKQEPKPAGRSWNSLATTPEDYARFAQGCLNKQVFPKSCDPFEFDDAFTMTKDGWAVSQNIPKSVLYQLGWGLIFGLQETQDGALKAWHNGDMNHTRAFVVFDVDKTGKGEGDVFVFICNARDPNNNNGLALLGSVIPKEINISPLHTYATDKLGFALDLRPGWEAAQKQRMDKIGKYFTRMKESRAQTLKQTAEFKKNHSPDSMSSSSVSFFSSSLKPSRYSQEVGVDVTKDEMADSAFGRGSHTAKK